MPDSLTVSASPTAPKLQYSVLPSRAGITIEPTEHGVTIRIPPRSVLFAFLAAIFASIMLLPMSVAIWVNVFHSHQRLYPDDWVKLIFLALIVLISWPLVIALVWQTVRRRRVPTILTVNGSTLILITPDQPKLRREFPIDQNLRLITKRRGYGSTLKPLGMLQIARNGDVFTCLQGRDLRLVQWIAHTLGEAMTRAQSVK